MFLAQYAGTCRGCGEVFDAGSEVQYTSASSGPDVIVAECCFGAAEINVETSATQTRDRLTMPRGKTAADRCDRCFIIHTAGQEGCE